VTDLAGRATPRPFVIGIASMPYGCFNGLITVALPYVLRGDGIAVSHIATIAAVVQVPAIWYFLWAPIVDVRLRRRTWIVALSALSAACAGVAIGRSASPDVRSLTTLLVAASVCNQPVSSAIGGLVASMVPDELRGRTGGWSQAGMLAGGVLAGGAAIWLAGHARPAVRGLVVAVLIATPSLAALAVREPSPSKQSINAHMAAMARDVWAALHRRDVRLGLLFFLSPIGAGALTNLFSAVAPDFNASTGFVMIVVAIGGVLTPLGAILGGIICDRLDRWRVYPIAGLTAAASAGAMVFAPLVSATYVAGAAAYALSTGFCYAAFMSLAFELVGADTVAGGTRFTIFMAAVNVPVAYMLRLDGWGNAHGGVHGMLAVDAASNAIFGTAFLVGVLALGSPRSPHGRNRAR